MMNNLMQNGPGNDVSGMMNGMQNGMQNSMTTSSSPSLNGMNGTGMNGMQGPMNQGNRNGNNVLDLNQPMNQPMTQTPRNMKSGIPSFTPNQMHVNQFEQPISPSGYMDPNMQFVPQQNHMTMNPEPAQNQEAPADGEGSNTQSVAEPETGNDHTVFGQHQFPTMAATARSPFSTPPDSLSSSTRIPNAMPSASPGAAAGLNYFTFNPGMGVPDSTGQFNNNASAQDTFQQNMFRQNTFVPNSPTNPFGPPAAGGYQVPTTAGFQNLMTNGGYQQNPMGGQQAYQQPFVQSPAAFQRGFTSTPASPMTPNMPFNGAPGNQAPTQFSQAMMNQFQQQPGNYGAKNGMMGNGMPGFFGQN
jgi:hypothetical protein